MKDDQESGLDNQTVVKMIVVALFFDGLQALLSLIYMGWLVGIFAGLTFWYWFYLHGVSFTKEPWKMATFGGATLLEVIPIPFVAALPAWTAAVATIALKSRISDLTPGLGMTKLGLNPNQPKGGAGGPAQPKPKPGNTPGGKQGEQKAEKDPKQSPLVRIEAEINKLKSDVLGWKAQIEQLKAERAQKMARLAELEQGQQNIARAMKETGGLTGTLDEKRIGELSQRGGRSLNAASGEISKLTMRITGLENTVYNSTNKLMSLEGQRAAARNQAA